jgi:hypothetical protein
MSDDKSWEEALDSLAQSVSDGTASGWEVELVRRRVAAELESLREYKADMEKAFQLKWRER